MIIFDQSKLGTIFVGGIPFLNYISEIERKIGSKCHERILAERYPSVPSHEKEKSLLCYRVFKGGGPKGGVSLMFPQVPQSSQTESLGFPSYPLPLDTL